MQLNFFPENDFPAPIRKPRQNQDDRITSDGPREVISRYSKLKVALDSDLFTNGNWFEVDTRTISNEPCDLIYVDLFSGGGGISVGARQSGLRKVLSVDVDPDASDTIRRNFPDSQHLEMPIEEISERLLDKMLDGIRVNVVFGGPPCQGFSVAGLRNPKDPRNQLFREYIRLVEHIKPDFVVMENVPGILSIEDGRVKDEIVRQLSEIGYPGVSVRILEAAAFGVPQLRTRAIFIANRHGLPNPYPKEFLVKADYRSIESAIDDLISNHEWTRHSKKFEERISRRLPL